MLVGSPWCSSSACFRQEPLKMNGTGFFTGRMPFLSPSQQWQSTEGNSHYWLQLRKITNWPYPVFIHYRSLEERDIAASMPVQQSQWHVCHVYKTIQRYGFVMLRSPKMQRYWGFYVCRYGQFITEESNGVMPAKVATLHIRHDGEWLTVDTRAGGLACFWNLNCCAMWNLPGQEFDHPGAPSFTISFDLHLRQRY